MEKFKAIPQGYMTVGEVAKKMDVSVRTLQYYDREGLLPPSAESEGGRRLYTDKDVIHLHQILSMKYLRFSLEAIKNRLIPLESPADMAGALTEHAAAIREKINALSESLQAVEALKEEVVNMQSVDFKKYADITVNLQMKNENYWMIKHFDEATLDHLRGRFDMDSGLAMLEIFKRLQNEAIRLQNEGVSPESEKGQDLAKEFWDMVMQFTDGDMSLLPKLMEVGKADGLDSGWKEKQSIVHGFIEPALGAYFDKLGLNPFEEGQK